MIFTLYWLQPQEFLLFVGISKGGELRDRQSLRRTSCAGSRLL